MRVCAVVRACVCDGASECVHNHVCVRAAKATIRYWKTEPVWTMAIAWSVPRENNYKILETEPVWTMAIAWSVPRENNYNTGD